MKVGWARLDELDCACLGTGWAEVDIEVWKKCPVHFEGQIHPESRALLLDEPNRLVEEERKGRLQYQIEISREYILDLQEQLIEQRKRLSVLELDLINRTPTVRSMPPVFYPDPADELDWSDLFSGDTLHDHSKGD